MQYCYGLNYSPKKKKGTLCSGNDEHCRLYMDFSICAIEVNSTTDSANEAIFDTIDIAKITVDKSMGTRGTAGILSKHCS